MLVADEDKINDDVVKEVFKIIDFDKDGVITLDDLNETLVWPKNH